MARNLYVATVAVEFRYCGFVILIFSRLRPSRFISLTSHELCFSDRTFYIANLHGMV